MALSSASAAEPSRLFSPAELWIATRRPFRKHLRENRPHCRAQHYPHAAGDNREHHVEGRAEAGDRVRTNVHLILPEGGATQRAHGRRQRRNLELFSGDIDADGRRRILVLACRIERVAVHAPVHTPPHEESEQPEREHDVVGEHAIGLELHRVQGKAIAVAFRLCPERAAGVVAQADDAEPHEFGERQREQPEIVPGDAEAEAGVADQHANDRRHEHGDRNAEPWRNTGNVPEHDCNVGPNAGEGAVPQRRQPEAAHQRPAGVDEGPQEDLDQQMQIVLLGRAEKDTHHQRQRGNRHQAGNRRS